MSEEETKTEVMEEPTIKVETEQVKEQGISKAASILDKEDLVGSDTETVKIGDTEVTIPKRFKRDNVKDTLEAMGKSFGELEREYKDKNSKIETVPDKYVYEFKDDEKHLDITEENFATFDLYKKAKLYGLTQDKFKVMVDDLKEDRKKFITYHNENQELIVNSLGGKDKALAFGKVVSEWSKSIGADSKDAKLIQDLSIHPDGVNLLRKLVNRSKVKSVTNNSEVNDSKDTLINTKDEMERLMSTKEYRDRIPSVVDRVKSIARIISGAE